MRIKLLNHMNSKQDFEQVWRQYHNTTYISFRVISEQRAEYNKTAEMLQAPSRLLFVIITIIAIA